MTKPVTAKEKTMRDHYDEYVFLDFSDHVNFYS